MKTLFIVTLLGMFMYCTKTDTTDPTPTNQMRCVDITPDVYNTMSGKWQICRVSPNNDISELGFTKVYDFRVHTDHDSLIVITTLKSIGTFTVDTIIYTLIRDYNIDVLSGYKLHDSSSVFTPWEFRANGEFWFDIYRLCKQ